MASQNEEDENRGKNQHADNCSQNKFLHVLFVSRRHSDAAFSCNLVKSFVGQRNTRLARSEIFMVRKSEFSSCRGGLRATAHFLLRSFAKKFAHANQILKNIFSLSARRHDYFFGVRLRKYSRNQRKRLADFLSTLFFRKFHSLSRYSSLFVGHPNLSPGNLAANPYALRPIPQRTTRRITIYGSIYMLTYAGIIDRILRGFHRWTK